MPGPGAAGVGAAAAAYKDKHEQVLRIAASDVAAVAGYHDWVDVRDLFLERLLYQDLDHLLRLDAANVGIEVEDRHQRSERLLAKAGNGELKAVRRKAGDGGAVETVQDAQALQNKARSLLKDAEGKKKLTKAEAKELESDLRHDINTQFGTRNENFALSVYERRSGTEVICSNERILVWPFPGSKVSGDGVPEEAMDPPTELSKGWTKKESRAGAGRAPSAAEEAAFASTVARCLAQLPALAAQGRVGGGEVIPASSTSSGTDNGDGCLKLTSTTIEGASNGTARGQNGEGSVEESEMMDVDTPVSEVAGEETVGGGAANSGEKRELVPGVAWPEWRGPRSEAGEAVLLVPPVEGSKVGEPASSAMAPGGGLLVPGAAGKTVGLGGERRGLWFPPSLTPQQRAAVTTAAGELGFCHDAVVAGEGGGVQVVVWEPTAAGVVGLPPDVPAAAVPVSPSCRSSARRGSSLLVPQSATTDLEPGRDSAGALEGSAQALGSQAGVRRGSMAVTRSADGVAPVLLAAATAAEADDGKSASSSSSVKGGTTTTPAAASEGTSSGSGAHGSDAVAAPATTVKSRMSVDHFSGDAVYAWGEGPPAAAAAAATPSEVLDVSEELPDGQEWSVWSRDPQAIVRGEGQGGEGGANNGAKEMEEEPSPGSGNKKKGGRAETLRERRKNACFVVVGAVDGVAEEVTDAPEDADTWETRRVVVEVKNRMNKASHPPPLYDQIQLVTYMLMIGAPVGDLVQFVKTGAAGSRGNGKRGASAKEARAAADDVLVSRVELDCRTYHHKKHWEETILPRLYAFARMVYRFRGDDLLRWRYLLAAPGEQREMLVECCPYLDDVIKRTPPVAAAEHPSIAPPSETRPSPEVVVLDGATGGTVETPAAVVAPQGGENGGTGSDVVAAPNGVQDGGARNGEDQDTAGVGSDGGGGGGGDGGGGSTVTVLCQKSRRGEPFLEPLRDAEVVATAADGETATSPARKKSKVGGGVAVEQHGLAV